MLQVHTPTTVAIVLGPYVSGGKYGGAEYFVLRLARTLREWGVRVILLAAGDAVVPPGIEFVPIIERSLVDSCGLDWEAVRGPAKEYYERTALWINENAAELGIKIALLNASAYGDTVVYPCFAHLECPKVFLLHSPYPMSQHGDQEAVDNLSQYGSGVPHITISNSFLNDTQAWTEQNGVAQHFCAPFMIYHGLRREDLYPMHERLDGSLFYFGRIDPRKGVGEALWAAHQERWPFDLTEVIQKAEVSQQWLEERVRPHIDGHFIRLVPPVDGAWKAAHLGGKIFLNPIDWEEPFGLTVLELLAAGGLLIATLRGAFKEILPRYGVPSCILIDAPTREGVASELRSVLRSLRGTHNTIDRTKGPEWVKKHFLMEEVTVQQYLEVFQEVIEANREQRPYREMLFTIKELALV